MSEKIIQRLVIPETYHMLHQQRSNEAHKGRFTLVEQHKKLVEHIISSENKRFMNRRYEYKQNKKGVISKI